MTTAAPAIAPDFLDAAHRAIERHGWEGATLERIAAEAGVSRMTLHRRGVTREALRQALGERLESRHDEAMLPALTHPGSGRERLELALAAEYELTEANLALIGALGAGGRDAIYHEAAPRALTRDAFTAPYKRILLDGAADGTLRETDVEETATVLLNLISHTYGHLRREHGWEPARARSAVVAVALDGVAP